MTAALRNVVVLATAEALGSANIRLYSQGRCSPTVIKGYPTSVLQAARVAWHLVASSSANCEALERARRGSPERAPTLAGAVFCGINHFHRRDPRVIGLVLDFNEPGHFGAHLVPATERPRVGTWFEDGALAACGDHRHANQVVEFAGIPALTFCRGPVVCRLLES